MVKQIRDDYNIRADYLFWTFRIWLLPRARFLYRVFIGNICLANSSSNFYPDITEYKYVAFASRNITTKIKVLVKTLKDNDSEKRIIKFYSRFYYFLLIIFY